MKLKQAFISTYIVLNVGLEIGTVHYIEDFCRCGCRSFRDASKENVHIKVHTSWECIRISPLGDKLIINNKEGECLSVECSQQVRVEKFGLQNETINFILGWRPRSDT